ncbi:MAG TPA: redoxin domain-containing protein [Chloroflexia bacterium]
MSTLWLILGGARRPDGASPQEQVTVGAVAPDFELTDVSTGEPVKLSSLRGRPVWLNFWATWCPPCKEELPRMQEVYSGYKAEGLAIVGIDMRENPADVREFVKSKGYHWTFVVDTDGVVTNRYFTAGIPTHVFVDAEGVIQAIHIGELDSGMMEEFLSKIVKSSGKGASAPSNPTWRVPN